MEAAPKELHPLFAHLERVELFIDLLLGNALQMGNDPLVPLGDVLVGSIFYESIVDLCCLPATFRDVCLEERYLIVVAEIHEQSFKGLFVYVFLHFVSDGLCRDIY